MKVPVIFLLGPRKLPVPEKVLPSHVTLFRKEVSVNIPVLQRV